MSAPVDRSDEPTQSSTTPTRSAVLGAAEGQETAAGGVSEMGRGLSGMEPPPDRSWVEMVEIKDAGKTGRSPSPNACPGDYGGSRHIWEWQHRTGSYACANCDATADDLVPAPASTQPRGAK